MIINPHDPDAGLRRFLTDCIENYGLEPRFVASHARREAEWLSAGARDRRTSEDRTLRRFLAAVRAEDFCPQVVSDLAIAEAVRLGLARTEAP